MRTQVSRWGNSLGVRIPKSCVDELGLAEGVSVEVKVSGRLLTISAAQREYSLETLVDAITAKNQHAESDWGPPQGKEVW